VALELKRLQQELCSQSFRRLYRELRQDHQVLCPFPTVFDLIEFFRDPKSSYRTRDEILGLLIRVYQKEGRYAPLSGLFVVLFTPGIVKIHMWARKRAPHVDPQEVLSETCVLLLEVIKHQEIMPGSSKVAARIMGRVKNRMRAWVNERVKEEQMMEGFWEDARYCPLPIIDEPGPPDPEQAEAMLSIFVRAGVITETDKWLILGTKVLGRSLKELAGTSSHYQRLKKRRQRALQAIRRYLEGKRGTYAIF